MSELITIEEAASLTGFPPEEIRYWVKTKKITSYPTKTAGRLVDLSNVRDFISGIESLGVRRLYLQLIIQEKEEEANEIVSRYDDNLLSLRSVQSISPLLKLIIAELATFIHNKQDRLIFTEVTSGTKVLELAKRCNISYDRLCLRYKNIVIRLKETTGFLAEFRKTIAGQEREIDRLRFQNRNLEYELKRLYEKTRLNGLPLDMPQSLAGIPSDAAKRICKPIENLTLSPYIRRCLNSLEIETIEDLLRYMRREGLDSLLQIPGFGELGLEQLKFQLEKHKIVNRNGHSDLFQYIIGDLDGIH